jgi:probable F420-dependent oxidoreductase
MDVGLSTFPVDDGIAPAELGRAAEDAGFAALFFAEHTHIPVAVAESGLDRRYWHTHDPFVALATVAQATERLRLGTGICLVTQRDPIVTARAVASLDRLSGGRFEFGIGAGWNFEELRNHGTDPQRRFSIMRERVQAMKAIWTQEEASFAGEHVRFDRMLCWPKPLQDPHPPVLIGGLGEKVHDRVLGYGDGWLPNRVAARDLAPRIAALRERAGRHVPVTYFGAEVDALEALAEAGVDRALIRVPPGPRDDVLAFLERHAELLARVG